MFLTEDVFLILGKTSILEHRKESFGVASLEVASSSMDSSFQSHCKGPAQLQCIPNLKTVEAFTGLRAL